MWRANSGVPNAACSRPADSQTATLVKIRLPPMPRNSCAEMKPGLVFMKAASAARLPAPRSALPKCEYTKVRSVDRRCPVVRSASSARRGLPA